MNIDIVIKPMTFAYYRPQIWLEILGVECGEIDGSLFYIEWTGDRVLIDILYLRQFFLHSWWPW